MWYQIILSPAQGEKNITINPDSWYMALSVIEAAPLQLLRVVVVSTHFHRVMC